MPSRLTETDRKLIDKARELAGLRGLDAIKEHAGEDDTAIAYAVTLGEAQHLLTELAIRLLTVGGGL